MPWCEPCSKFHTPGTAAPDGTCPDCGGDLELGEHAAAAAEMPIAKVPWHFWVGVAAMVLYLGWRVIQGVALLF